MQTNYDDIISRISEPPLWFDENAVPRYCAFSPKESSPYLGEIALAEIDCQGLWAPFLCRVLGTQRKRFLQKNAAYGIVSRVSERRVGRRTALFAKMAIARRQ